VPLFWYHDGRPFPAAELELLRRDIDIPALQCYPRPGMTVDAILAEIDHELWRILDRGFQRIAIVRPLYDQQGHWDLTVVRALQAPLADRVRAIPQIVIDLSFPWFRLAGAYGSRDFAQEFAALVAASQGSRPVLDVPPVVPPSPIDPPPPPDPLAWIPRAREVFP
jgi:hypothetical protein